MNKPTSDNTPRTAISVLEDIAKNLPGGFRQLFELDNAHLLSGKEAAMVDFSAAYADAAYRLATTIDELQNQRKEGDSGWRARTLIKAYEGIAKGNPYLS